MIKMNDTIAAISTSLGVGAISIIRISGNGAVEIVNKIVKNKNINSLKTHTINYNHIVEGDKIVDEVLISLMKGPKSFTTEDVIEINAHGGIATTNKILQLLLQNGCRLATPGEFTKRAYLNGRIDLMQAEGIMDLINSKTDKMRDLAISQVGGNISQMIKDIRKKIIEVLANIEVNIDYPEYEDIEVLTNEQLFPKLNHIELKIEAILKNSENSRLIKEGIDTCIIGKPNVGKSSLLNKLLNEEKAIVTDIAGTTRDIVEGTIIIEGIIFNIIDTAGIRKTSDLVESIGVKKSIDLIDKSDLVLFVLNNNEELTQEEEEILSKLKDKNYIIVVNKIDLETKLNLKDYDLKNMVSISTINNQGIEDLKNKIKEIYNLEQIETTDVTYLTNARSIALLNEALKAVKTAKSSIQDNIPIDMVEIDIKEAWSKLGEIIGQNYSEELIDQLFSQFCLGK